MHREVFENELLAIREMLLEMGGMARDAMNRSIGVLRDRDLDAARELIENDELINGRRIEIEEACLRTIATQQPVAGDLRMIFSVLEIATEVERIADYAKGNARISLLIGDRPLVKPLVNLSIMCDRLASMLEDSLKAFLENDTEKAVEVAGRDRLVDELNQQTQRELLTFIMEDARILSGALYLTWVSHNLERTGDRVVNICERIIFAATGRFEDL